MGLQRGKVKLARFNSQWVDRYRAEEKSLKLCLKPQDYLAINHVGSTAIKGISAKPIVDVLVGVTSLKKAKKIISDLESCGYEYKSEDVVPNRLFFAKGEDSNRTVYLHVAEVSSDYYKDKLLFRDYLNNHPEKSQSYDKLKQYLASQHANDRGTYTEAKTEFIVETVKEAKKLLQA